MSVLAVGEPGDRNLKGEIRGVNADETVRSLSTTFSLVRISLLSATSGFHQSIESSIVLAFSAFHLHFMEHVEAESILLSRRLLFYFRSRDLAASWSGVSGAVSAQGSDSDSLSQRK